MTTTTVLHLVSSEQPDQAVKLSIEEKERAHPYQFTIPKRFLSIETDKNAFEDPSVVRIELTPCELEALGNACLRLGGVKR